MADSSANKFQVSVDPSGNVYFARYGTTEFNTVPAGSWFPFTLTWIVD